MSLVMWEWWDLLESGDVVMAGIFLSLVMW